MDTYSLNIEKRMISSVWTLFQRSVEIRFMVQNQYTWGQTSRKNHSNTLGEDARYLMRKQWLDSLASSLQLCSSILSIGKKSTVRRI